MKSNLLAGLITLAAMSTPALAYDYTYMNEGSTRNGFERLYAGAAVGLLGGDGAQACSEKDLDCSTWKAYAGYRSSEHLAYEAGFHSFLDTRSTLTTNDVDVSALSLSVMGIMATQTPEFMNPVLPQQDIEVFAKLGMAAWDSKTNHATVVGGTDFLLGAGATKQFTDNIHLRGEMEYIGGDIDSTNYTAGLTYSTF